MVWLDGSEFLAAIGENFWKFDLNRLTKAEAVAPHLLKIPHAMKRTALAATSLTAAWTIPPAERPARLASWTWWTGTARRIPLPTTCWHLVCHPILDVFYAISFRVLPGDGRDWQEWGMAYSREYAYEIDAETGQVLRHWSAGRDMFRRTSTPTSASPTASSSIRGQPDRGARRPGDHGHTPAD